MSTCFSLIKLKSWQFFGSLAINCPEEQLMVFWSKLRALENARHSFSQKDCSSKSFALSIIFRKMPNTANLKIWWEFVECKFVIFLPLMGLERLKFARKSSIIHWFEFHFSIKKWSKNNAISIYVCVPLWTKCNSAGYLVLLMTCSEPRISILTYII